MLTTDKNGVKHTDWHNKNLSKENI